MSAHFRFPRREFPQQGSLSAACNSLPNFLLLSPLQDRLPPQSYTCPGSPPFLSVPLPSSLLPSRDFPRQGSLPATCDSLLHFLLLPPPRDSLPLPLHTQTCYPPSESMPLPRSLLRALRQTRFLLRMLPRIRRPFCRIPCRPATKL